MSSAPHLRQDPAEEQVVLEPFGEHRLDRRRRLLDQGRVGGVRGCGLEMALMETTRRSIVRTSSTRIVSRAATARTTTKPPMIAPTTGPAAST